MPTRSELQPGDTLPSQGRAMSDAEIALWSNHTLIGFLDLPSRQGPCLISDLSQVPPETKMSKRHLWMAKLKPCF